MNDLFLEIPWVETSEAEFTYKRTGPVVDIGKELAWRAGLFDEAFREIQWIENADGE